MSRSVCGLNQQFGGPLYESLRKATEHGPIYMAVLGHLCCEILYAVAQPLFCLLALRCPKQLCHFDRGSTLIYYQDAKAATNDSPNVSLLFNAFSIQIMWCH